MKVSKNIKPYPKFFNKIAFSKKFGGHTLYPYIFLREDFYKSLLTPKPSIWAISILKHEMLHLERQKKGGIVWFLKYLFIPSFCFNEEFLAYEVQIKYLKKFKEKLNIENVARNLSGSMYLWAVSYEKAKEKLEKV